MTDNRSARCIIRTSRILLRSAYCYAGDFISVSQSTFFCICTLCKIFSVVRSFSAVSCNSKCYGSFCNFQRPRFVRYRIVPGFRSFLQHMARDRVCGVSDQCLRTADHCTLNSVCSDECAFCYFIAAVCKRQSVINFLCTACCQFYCSRIHLKRAVLICYCIVLSNIRLCSVRICMTDNRSARCIIRTSRILLRSAYCYAGDFISVSQSTFLCICTLCKIFSVVRSFSAVSCNSKCYGSFCDFQRSRLICYSIVLCFRSVL